MVLVERVRVEDPNVHLPFLEVVGGDEVDAGGEGLLDLRAEESVNISIMVLGCGGREDTLTSS